MYDMQERQKRSRFDHIPCSVSFANKVIKGRGERAERYGAIGGWLILTIAFDELFALGTASGCILDDYCADRLSLIG